MTIDIWARCEPCDTWFACPEWFDRNATAPTCPACGRDPGAIENRAHANVRVVPDLGVGAAAREERVAV